RIGVHTMRNRTSALAALTVALFLAGPVTGRADDGPSPAAPAAPAAPNAPAGDSVSAPPGGAAAASSSPVANLRAAYATAFSQRRAGAPVSAIGTAEAALLQIEVALSEDPDAQTRAELVELRAKLSGLRDAAETDLHQPAKKIEPGNEADDRVLNAPAVDAIQPQFNDQVYKWIEYFCGAGRPVFEKWLRRSGRYMHLFRSVLEREGLPPDLVHL